MKKNYSKEKREIQCRPLFSLRRLLWGAVLSFLALGVSAQNRTVSGTVVDVQNAPIPGATVMVDGSGRAVTCGSDGTFSLTNVPPSGNLVVKMLGFIPRSVALDSRTEYRITLEEDNVQLDEVVVIGYGVVRKSDVTGAVVSVGADKLQERPVTNAFEALQGKAAGVDITMGGRPGELGRIRIRGERSITASSEPLYVVDGIPMQGDNNISMLNTYDIKSIEILKDASATAIYGSRGANGVVLVTTNRGEAGRYSIDYNGSLSFTSIKDARETFSASEYIDFIRWGNYYADMSRAESGRTGYKRADQPDQELDRIMFGSDPYAWANVMRGWEGGSWDPSKVQTTDWVDYVTRTGITHNHSLSVSGGTEKSYTRASVGYLNEKGTSYGQGMERYNLSISSVIKPKDWFEMGVSVTAAWTDQDYGQDGTGGPGTTLPQSVYESAYRLYPYAVPFDENGNRIINPGGEDAVKTIIDEWKYTTNRRQRLQALANVYAQIQLPIEGLTYRFTFGPGFRFHRNGVFVSPESTIRSDTKNLVRLRENRQITWNLQNQINYIKSFDKHNVALTLVQEANKYEAVSSNIDGQDHPVPEALWNNMGSITKDYISYGSGLTESQMASYLVRGNYSYNNRYILTVSGRWDGSSVLAEGNKWAFFPSAAVAWRLEQEDFLKNTTWINQLKLRLGYGVTGNAAVDPYSTLGSIGSKYFPYGDDYQLYYYAYDPLGAKTDGRTLPNMKLGWEKTSQWNLGVDFSILGARVNGTLEYYASRTTDLLLSSSIPTINGYGSTTANVGKTKNNGVDFTLNTVNVMNGDFRWETSLNLSWQRNEIVELSNGKEDDVANSRFIGQPIGIYYGYENLGLWREEDAEEMAKFNEKAPGIHSVGNARPKDQNGDNLINANDDRTIIGRTTPTWSGALSNTFSWRGVELSVMINSRLGYWTDGGDVTMAGRYGLRKVDYYNENNKNASYQRPEYNTDGSSRDPYSAILGYSKADFVNIRHISLGYVFPRNLLKNWGMENLRIYGQVVNPGAIYSACDFKFMDVGSNGGFYYNRQFVFGLSVSF